MFPGFDKIGPLAESIETSLRSTDNRLNDIESRLEEIANRIHQGNALLAIFLATVIPPPDGENQLMPLDYLRDARRIISDAQPPTD